MFRGEYKNTYTTFVFLPLSKEKIILFLLNKLEPFEITNTSTHLSDQVLIYFN